MAIKNSKQMQIWVRQELDFDYERVLILSLWRIRVVASMGESGVLQNKTVRRDLGGAQGGGVCDDLATGGVGVAG